MKDTCKQAIFRKDTKGAKRVRDLYEEEIKRKRELEFFNTAGNTMNGKVTSLGSLLGMLEKLSKGIAGDTIIKLTHTRGF